MANLLSTTVNGSLLALNNGVTNAYTTASNGRLYLGSSAQNDYSIYTHMENFGGNYTKLTLDWHTGIKIGASQAYGGIRFYSDSINNGGVKLFSVGEGDAHVRVENNLYVGNTIYNNGNAVIHAGNIGSQSVSYASSAGNADTLDGYHSNTVGNRHHTARGFTVGGDQNTYYPVTFGGSGAYAFNRYSIYRYYQWTAPWDPLGTGYHRGGLTFDFEWSGDTAWGGNDHTLRVIQLSEQYTSQVGGLALPVTQGVCVWLRGGTSYYEIQVDAYPVDVVVHLEGFTAGNGAFFGPREDNSNIQSEIYNRMPVRGSSELYDGGSRVITAGNIGSQSVSYATSSGNSVSTDQTNFSELFIEDSAVATKEYVTSQGYLTSLPSHNHDDRYYTESESDSRFVNATGDTMTGTLAMHEGAYYGTITFGSTAYWRAGISQRDAANAELRIWAKGGDRGSIYFATNYDGESGATTLPSDGMALKNNNLGIGGFTNIEFPSHKLHVKGTAYATSDFRAPIFYDSQDTGFYVDPNSESKLYRLNVGGSNHSLENTEAVLKFRNTVNQHNYIVSNASGWNSWSQWIRYAEDYNTWRIGTYDEAAESGTSVWRLAGRNRPGNGELNYIVAGPRGAWGDSDRVVLWNPYARYDGGAWNGDGTHYEVITAANIGSQSVSYASSAGNADTVDSLHASSFVRNDTTGQYLRAYYQYGSYLTSERPIDLRNQMGGSGMRVDFMIGAGGGSWNHVITFSGYDAYNMYQLGGYYDGGSVTNLYVRSEANHGTTSWTAWRRLLNEVADPYAVNMNQYVRTTDGPTFAEVFSNGWFRNYGNQGIYNQSYGTHFYSSGGNAWSITGSGGTIELIFRSNHQSTVRGYVYADTSNNIGFLNNAGNWSLRTDSSRNTQLYGNLTVGQDAGASSIFMYDSDEGTREIHCNSNRIGFLTQAGSWGAWLYDSADWEAAGSVRAPIFYDSNDTNYYLDPAGTSRLGGLMLEANLETGRATYGADKANLVLLASSTYGRAAIDFRSGVNYPTDGAQIYYETATNLSSGETSRLVIRTENDADDSILIRGGFIELNSTTVDGGSSSPGVRTQYNGNNRLLTYSDHTAETSSFNAPQFLVNNHSDNTRGYRIYNTSGSSVSAMFTNSSNALVIGAGAFDQVNLNKKVFVNGVALGVNVGPSGTAGRIDASNDIVAFSSSDERLKHNIAPIENALDKVKSLTGVEFDWKPEHKHAHGYQGHDTGIIAQQVQAVMPSAVRTNDTGFLAVRYEKLIGLLVEANKELAARVEELEKKLG